MYKNIFFILLILVAGVATFVAFQSSSGVSASKVQEVTPVATEQQTPQQSERTQSQNGIDVTIENIEQGEDTTVLTLGLSNHRYDLGQDSIYTTAELNGQTAVSHTMLSNAVGGHHVQAQVVFNKTTSGSFQITPVEGTTFTFEDLW